jgi:hypothetical protein
MKYAGFVSLPIEGDPSAQLQNVLDQIQSALVDQHVDNVERSGNRILFSAGFLSFKRSVRRNPLSLITSGEIEINPASDNLMVDYRLSFTQLFILGMAAALFYLSTSIGRDQPLTQTVFVSAVICVGIFAGNAAIGVSRFSKFLRQFPSEA